MPPRVLWQGEWTGCWLAQFAPETPCEGGLIRAHLLPKRLLLRELPAEESARLLWDERVWAPACGGVVGNGGHHGQLDHSRRLRIPRAALPVALEDLAAEVGLGWWLDREYGAVAA